VASFQKGSKAHVFPDPVANFSNDLAHGESCQNSADAQTADFSEENKGQNCRDQ
jgi:hypothetical protein